MRKVGAHPRGVDGAACSRVPRLALLLALVCITAAALAGCGGGDDSTDSTATKSQGPAGSPAATTTTPGTDGKKAGGSKESDSQAEVKEEPFVPRPHQDSGGGSAQFEVKGGDNSVQEFGEEGSESELEKAAGALHGFLDARAAGDWAAACSYLAAPIAKSLQQFAATSPQLKGAGCPQLLAALSKGVPASTLAEAAEADVGSLRLEADRAFLIYRGAGKTVYAISMTKEGDSWKVAGLSGAPLN